MSAAWIAVVLAGLLLGGCSRREAVGGKDGAVGKPGALRKVVLQTDWFPQAEHGGFYQALAKGFYREVGLEVEIMPGGPNSFINQKVARGDADFGMHRSDNIMKFAGEGLPLVMVAATFQHDPQALMVRADSPVKTLADLAGRNVMGNSGMMWIPYVKKKYGIDFGVTPNNYNLTTFLADPTLIQQCLVTNEPFVAQQHGIAVRTLSLADSGYDCYQVLFCRSQLLRERPEVVRAFIAASIRGWRDYITADPSPADQLILQRNPQTRQEVLTFSRDEMIRRGLVRGDAAKGEDVGQLSLARIAAQHDALVDLKVLSKPLTISQIATRDFLPTEKP